MNFDITHQRLKLEHFCSVEEIIHAACAYADRRTKYAYGGMCTGLVHLKLPCERKRIGCELRVLTEVQSLLDCDRVYAKAVLKLLQGSGAECCVAEER